MNLHLIYARAANGVIGLEGRLPWHLPEDLAHFKALTMGMPVIMGRKTWYSLPERFRPLPGRLNLVITRQADWRAPGAQACASLRDAVAHCPPGTADAWIIGGAEIFTLAAPHARSAAITEIGRDFAGDALAPALGPAWHEVARECHQSASGLPYCFVTQHNTHVQPL
jgi:dihydrofolate reductase